jgi:SagB-type dehydrogenase family enzyme
MTPHACQLLDLCHDWTTIEDLGAANIMPRSALPAEIDRLVSLSLLERSDRPMDPRERAMASLRPWNPAAGFFHTTTRDLPFVPQRLAARYARAKARHVPPPAAIKRYRHVETIDLARPAADDDFADVLRARRTWRRYSKTPIAIDQLATMLALAAGVQQWITGADVEIPLKTSPSGGARHAIEAYVVARDVRGLKAGVYHYAPDRHALERIGPRVSIARLRAYVPQSEYFASASAMVFLTAIFDRILWRYPYPRAYRAALIEAGHVCQTFCLAATKLGLAPFSVMALADSLIEHDLGIDGITEAVLYGAGVGRPPRGASWAPLAKGPNPRVKINRRIRS